ncbi:serine carboxypeptidase-like 35 isoform X1 [Dioscorea cayenensis subsp. rotundata]|uniref:Carboxypeptidase n=1 Tax=Dioscorea cayennensis subsp. rotundata TaxID=55577 RepID=A0AB40CCG8_DIOCR|nr:serine carboxypeptidase-like 35 isoform X1 [Dioscorea cayenensis subsp. rotundata]
MAYRSSVFHSIFTFLIVSTLSDAAQTGAADLRPESDLVTGLPGQPPVEFRHYAGYVYVGQSKDKALFYWFFEAIGAAEAKPLLLWLNGGPGCSSVAFGAAQELGPFLIRTNKPNLTLNAYSWNKVANLLFLEAPIGVGFSYSNRSSDLEELGDEITAKDSHEFLLAWFDKFPAFKSHEFYLAGESYAGHYVPQLAELIYEGNKRASEDSRINFKGLMIGNAVLNDETDQMGMVEYAWSHAIISDQLYNTIRKECAFFKESEKKKERDKERAMKETKACSLAIKAFLQSYSDIDIYSIYTPVCRHYSSNVSGHHRHRRPKLVASPRLFRQHEEWHELERRVPAGYDPCTEGYVEKYFNRKDVQQALHANLTGLSYPYSPCSEVIPDWKDSPPTVLPILKKLMNAGLRVWVYSGDTDGRVPVTSTRYSINEMGLKVKEKTKGKEWGGWRAWYHKDQVAGWVVEYQDGLTLATVRGAGHQVPAFAPDRSLLLVAHFLNGKPPPSHL